MHKGKAVLFILVAGLIFSAQPYAEDDGCKCDGHGVSVDYNLKKGEPVHVTVTVQGENEDEAHEISPGQSEHIGYFCEGCTLSFKVTGEDPDYHDCDVSEGTVFAYIENTAVPYPGQKN
jgi:hypothetical protein